MRVAGPIFDHSLALEMLSFFDGDVAEGHQAVREKRAQVFPSTRSPRGMEKAGEERWGLAASARLPFPPSHCYL